MYFVKAVCPLSSCFVILAGFHGAEIEISGHTLFFYNRIHFSCHILKNAPLQESPAVKGL